MSLALFDAPRIGPAACPRILVTGSREWTDRDLVNQALAQAWIDLGRRPDAVLVHGACRGADIIARDLWLDRGLADEPHPADWDHCDCACRHAPAYRRDGTPYCRVAGRRRNQAMVDLGADLLLAFPLAASSGTRHCIRRAVVARIPVREYALAG